LRRLLPTPSMAVALAALVVAASGGAYAAVKGSPRTITVCVHHKGGGLYTARKYRRDSRGHPARRDRRGSPGHRVPRDRFR
jgi:hypothetical protein